MTMGTDGGGGRYQEQAHRRHILYIVRHLWGLTLQSCCERPP